jgi:hypothetical protein
MNTLLMFISIDNGNDDESQTQSTQLECTKQRDGPARQQATNWFE